MAQQSANCTWLTAAMCAVWHPAARLLLRGVVAVPEVPQPGHNELLVIQALVQGTGDDLHRGIGLQEGLQALGTADDVEEDDAVGGHALVDQNLDRLESAASGGQHGVHQDDLHLLNRVRELVEEVPRALRGVTLVPLQENLPNRDGWHQLAHRLQKDIPRPHNAHAAQLVRTGAAQPAVRAARRLHGLLLHPLQLGKALFGEHPHQPVAVRHVHRCWCGAVADRRQKACDGPGLQQDCVGVKLANLLRLRRHLSQWSGAGGRVGHPMSETVSLLRLFFFRPFDLSCISDEARRTVVLLIPHTPIHRYLSGRSGCCLLPAFSRLY
eukprot:RCo018676